MPESSTLEPKNEEWTAALAEQGAAIAERDAALAEQGAAIAERDAGIAELAAMKASSSWRITAPIRRFVQAIRHLERNGPAGRS